ncbi:MAG: hypothetical protein R2854_04195 [Caldilineaceae bacterium]
MIQALEEAVVVGPQRDITTDPEYGIQQLTNIAWFPSPARQVRHPPGSLTIFSLRDILALGRRSSGDGRQPRRGRGAARGLPGQRLQATVRRWRR